MTSASPRLTPRRLAEMDREMAAPLSSDGAASLAAELRSSAARSLDPDALSRLGQLRLSSGDWVGAVACGRLASALCPSNLSFRFALGDWLAQGGATLAALRCYDEAVAMAPESAEAVFARAQGRHLLCRLDEALEDYDEALRRQPGMVQAASFRMVAMNYREPGQAVILEAAKAYGAQLPHGAAARDLRGGGGGTKLRVGILSPDLRQHSVSYFLAPLLDRIPSDIEVVLFRDSNLADATTARMAKNAALTETVAMLDNAALAERMRGIGLDVAIDLAGHFSKHRLPVFAARVAPVQAAYLGYPNTTGVPAMDWRIGDGWIDDFEGSVGHWTERLTTLPGGMLAYEPPSDAPAVGRGPDTLTFGYFGHLGKITAEVAATWVEILASAPGSKLMIKGDAMDDPVQRAHWEAKLCGWGLPKEALDLRPKVASRAEHLAMYGQVSATLDTWPYNGTTTTCESLWMGVPVVSVDGYRHASRVGHSLLLGAGQPVASSIAEYAAQACEWASCRRRIARSDLAGAAWLAHDRVAEEFWLAVRRMHEGRPS